MQLLTTLIRRRIEMMILDAIDRLPPNAQPTDPQFLAWLESLIRYHTHEPMEPAKEKPPVLGGIGIADAPENVMADAPDEEDELMLETGLLSIQLGTAAAERYLTAALSGDLSDDDPWHDVLTWPDYTFDARAYTAGMDSIAFPASHGRSDYGVGDTGSQTGKLLLLWQCLAGSRQSYTDLAEMIAGPGSTGLSYGLYTNEDNAYYLIKVTTTSVSAAQLQFSWLGSQVYADLLDDLSGAGIGRIDKLDEDHEEYLKHEAYVLATALTVGEWVQIGTIDIEGSAVYGGWKWRWNGDRGVIVTHEKEYDLIDPEQVLRLVARSYTMIITGDTVETMDATVVETETKGWRPASTAEGIKPDFSSPALVRMTKHNWITCPNEYYGGTADLHESTGIPVYAWFDERDEIIYTRAKKENISTGLGLSALESAAVDSLDESVYTCGGGTVSGIYEAVGSGYKYGFYIDAGASSYNYTPASWDEMSAVSGSPYYYQYRSWGGGGLGTKSACSDLSGSESIADPDNANGKYCGNPIEWWYPGDGCGGEHLMTASNARPELTQDIFKSLSATSASHAMIIPAHNGASVYLLKNQQRFSGYRLKGWQNWDAHVSISRYYVDYREDPILLETHVVRVPQSSFNSTLKYPFLKWPCPVNFSLLGKLPGQSHSFSERNDRDTLSMAYVMAGDQGAELIHEYENDVEEGEDLWGDEEKYSALLSIPCADPSIDYRISHKASAIGKARLYHGDLSQVPIEPLSNNTTIPAELVEDKTLWSGRN